MAKVIFHISMSLDGFITGPHPRPEDPLGDAGRLHDWMFDAQTEVDAEVLDEVNTAPGAIVIGRRMFDEGVGPWGDPPPFHRPVFVVTHRPQSPIPRQGGTTYHFVTGGIEAAVKEAASVAGGKPVGLWGGADLIQQALQAGLIDEFHLHLIPILLGGGVRLFDHLGEPLPRLRKTRAIDTPNATHLRYTVLR